MKILITLLLLLFFGASFGQWERVTQLPDSTIFTLYAKNGVLYAGGKAIVYYSTDNGRTWDSTGRTDSIQWVDNIIVYKNELYISILSKAVFKSADNGRTWQNISAGIFPFLSAFVEYRGNLYASTLGGGVFKLDPVRLNRWNSFNAGLSNQSSNLTTMIASDNALITGTNANGIYDRLEGNSNTWEEKLLLNRLTPVEGILSLVSQEDSLLLAGTTGSIYFSTDDANSWIKLANTSPVANTTIVNTKQAYLIARTQVTNGFLGTFFKYLRKDSLDHPFVNFSTVPNHFNLKLEVFGGQIWDASSTGLFHMPLSLLPGITSAEEIPLILPIHFESFEAQLQSNKTVLLTWRTSFDANSHYFTVERSSDSVTWDSIAMIPLNPTANYIYTDLLPKSGYNYYRIRETDIDKRTTFSNIKRIELKEIKDIMTGPNPVSGLLHVRFPYNNGRADIIDVSGRTIYSTVIRSYQLDIPVQQYMAGAYFLKVWHQNEIHTVTILKQ